MIQKELLLQAKNVSKYFYEPEKFKVLNNISFDIHKGEFVTMVGKSGSGKSTLLYLLSTMDTDYEGNIFFDSENLTHKTKEELAAIRNEKIGFVFQFHYLLPEFSSLKNVMIPALKLGKYSKPEIEERAYSILTKLDLKDQALKPANKLSGGQQQRVAIARALINDPKIIMGDEPTGNLDSKNAAIVFDLFKQLTTQFDQTVLAVTHDNDFAKASDRIIEMADGIIL
ncbi:ABC transporter ATP-binding protein [Flavobacterium psychrophilum]|jgi:lipoprotein-releasing system ATP-binding protein|uniref:Lipoprotein releasing system ATP-binding protein LolD n=3 Tax=Flavobacterium psychrophilum TaxID=96345 RepID=A6GY43_FLAPJ|nr:ABC transporter ATP-binding protein [Flavobacterium psychrophilum]AIG29738.1 ATP-binding protein [Flavobacterium psychrophilum]AIG32015.1 ATP-binding protein [Flavobacterium psychrophilum]AIG34170.1 ATP-binding protein [Flavobacterium psychrophilum]AIG36533.1 ATP-binding protein [Flavobacterium psychrophilum]AIG38798.1 ATP-binding protein [Flavobacterium psychrophilum]